GGTLFPSLPALAHESHELASKVSGSAFIVAKDTAPVDIVRAMASAPLAHFAGHGWSNRGDGALVLGADESGRTRFLTATEMASQPWNSCRLAVLSACLTAAANERGPVDPQSLVRALLAAGAQRVVAARWSIDSESTRRFMGAFYDSLFKGSAPAVALQQASTAVRAEKGWEHPYYWAAFDLFGVL